MIFDTLISTQLLAENLDRPDWLIVDCRFSLADTEKGKSDYLRTHIPGAVYAHLDEDLSGEVIPAQTGRHPLPSIEKVVRIFSQWGIDEQIQVVAYDDAGGALAACRLWWMLRWLGHNAVAILDGGWQKWQAEGKSVCSGIEKQQDRRFVANIRHELLVTTEEVDRIRLDPTYRLFDSRSADRFRGENETIDPVAGHIPGALSFPYTENLNPDGTFLSKEILRQKFDGLVTNIPASRVVFYCGSGVTSILNIVGMQYAGVGEARLYVGSWSEWIVDMNRPITTGEI